VKLLRVLQDGSFEPVGSEHTVQVNARVISATNKQIEEEVLAGRFRKDLYYRLCVMPIIVLPLRDRREDIPHLVEYFLDQFFEEAGGKKITLSSTALSISIFCKTRQLLSRLLTEPSSKHRYIFKHYKVITRPNL